MHCYTVRFNACLPSILGEQVQCGRREKGGMATRGHERTHAQVVGRTSVLLLVQVDVSTTIHHTRVLLLCVRWAGTYKPCFSDHRQRERVQWLGPVPWLKAGKCRARGYIARSCRPAPRGPGSRSSGEINQDELGAFGRDVARQAVLFSANECELHRTRFGFSVLPYLDGSRWTPRYPCLGAQGQRWIGESW